MVGNSPNTININKEGNKRNLVSFLNESIFLAAIYIAAY